MQTKSPDAPDFRGVTVLAGSLLTANTSKPLVPFHDGVLDFLDALAKVLLKSQEAKAYPEVVTFGFFCRKGNLLQLKAQYAGRLDGRLGRGLAFHIAPSNVPINFGYSLLSGLLAGNANLVKASSKDFAQTRIVCQAMQDVLARSEFAMLQPYVNVVMYDRERQELTEFFSSICNVRVIWGGDRTIAAVRRAPLPPRAVELTFADRYSLAVIKAETILPLAADHKKLAALAQAFYNDTYLFDQNACTSPRLIYWLGEEDTVAQAKAIFWQAVHDNIKDRYQLEAETAVNKLMAVAKTAIEIPGSTQELGQDNLIVRVHIPVLPKAIAELRAAGGLFHEYTATSLDDLMAVVDEKYQTITYYGCNPQAIRASVLAHGVHGIDKIVPIGHSADWLLTWDGFDLITDMSRMVVYRDEQV